MRFSGALCTSIALHLAALVLLSRSSGADTQARQEGAPLPPMVFEVRIEPPQLHRKQEAVVHAPPVESPLPRAKSSRSADAVRVLTPPPHSLPKSGAEDPPAVEQMGILETNYFPASELTLSPRPTTEPEIILPPGWLEAYGQAELTLYVNTEGKVDELVLGKSNLPQELQEAVRAAFQSLAFKPGEINGQPVPSAMTIEADVSISLGTRR